MVIAHPQTFDEMFDVIVVGSGGAALTAAVHRRRRRCRGARRREGRRARRHHRRVRRWRVGAEQPPPDRPAGSTTAGTTRSPTSTHIADGRALDPSLIEVFVDTVNEVIEYLEAKTPLETQPVPALVDYYGAIIDRIPGCKPFSRTIEPLPFAAREQLGDEWADRVAARSTLLSLGASTTLREDMDAMFGGGMQTGLDELAERERAGVRVKGGGADRLPAQGDARRRCRRAHLDTCRGARRRRRRRGHRAPRRRRACRCRSVPARG